ncbi:MAG: TIM barrel protein [Rhodobacteraceae bacterium]|nr:TIM barrel protein [Paracoccaceae bacterium]
MVMSVSTTSVPGSLADKLKAIADAGFDTVDIHEPDITASELSPADVGRLASDLGLGVGFLQPFRDLEGQVDTEATFARFEEKLKLASLLGAKGLLVTSATVNDDTADVESCLADLKRAAELARKHDQVIAYMALPWAKSVCTDIEALDVVSRVDAPNFGLALNSFFSLADGSKPARLREVPGHKLFHVQLSDAPRLETDIRHLKRHFGLLPGLGALNLSGFVKVLARGGYEGAWSVARVNETAPQPGGTTLARDSYRALVNLLDEVARSEPGVTFGTPAMPARVYASGFEFIEFTSDEASARELGESLAALSFRRERKHVSKQVELWRQGSINFVINKDPEGFARKAFLGHGPSVCDMGLRVKDAAQTVARATALGAPDFSQPVGIGELDIPAIRGVGGSVVHFIDEQSDLHRVWDIEFDPVQHKSVVQPAGLRRIDHVAQTMRHDEMQSWLLYYLSTFDMSKAPIHNVADPSGVVHSQAIESPEGEVRLNLNGAVGRNTLAASFLQDGLGAGVQHIALLTDDIFETSEILAQHDFGRLKIPQNYYADLRATFGLDDDFVARLQAGSILYDREGAGEYFQIYSRTMFNGFFFEIVQRKGGYAGFGARNAPIRLAAQQAYAASADQYTEPAVS